MWTMLFLAVMILTLLVVIVSPIPLRASAMGLPCTETITGPGQLWLDCLVTSGTSLDFRDIRQYTRTRPEKINVTMNCSGGKVYLPWPFRAANMVALTVTGCTIEGFLSERLVQLQDPDVLQYVVVSDVTMVMSIDQMYESMNDLTNITRDFNCGPVNAKESIFRNVNYDFHLQRDAMTEALLLERMLSGDLMKTILNLRFECAYPELQYMEESGSRSMSSVRFKLAQENKYPKLTSYSIKNNSLGRIPNELKDLSFSFLPKLERIDMSDNLITDLDFDVPKEPNNKKPVYVDLRRNGIQEISAQFVFRLGNSNYAVIDLRDNPLSCSCPLYLYGLYLEKLSRADRSLLPLRDLTCFSMQGGTFSMLDENFGRSLCNPFV